jgi:glycosyltransferase involved in cell wall biosynthesis
MLPDRPDVMVVEIHDFLELRRHLLAVDLLLLPARAESGFLLMSEAWRSGTAVLASSDNAPIKRDLEASAGGMTYSNAEEFVFAVNELIEHKDTYSSAGLSWLNSLPGCELIRALDPKSL